MVDQAPQFNKLLDQAPTLFLQWCGGWSFKDTFKGP